MADSSRFDSYPQYARDATSYVLVKDPTNTSRESSIRAGRWETVLKFSGHRDGVALARREGGVSKRHLYTLEHQGQLRLNTSPKGGITSELTLGKRYVQSAPVMPEDDESRYPEGTASYVQHRKLERDGSLAKRAKRSRLVTTGRLSCDVCAFEFRRAYGAIGESFIEAHHTVPVSELAGIERTKMSNLALVCSNCHRMLHSGQHLLSVLELKELMLRAKNET
jgi:HNH endonuclease